MWNYAAVYGGRMGLKILARGSSEMCKSLKSEFSMMFAKALMCWECRYTSLLMRVQTNHRDTVLWISYLTGLNEALYIHPRELELSVKARMCNNGTSCWMSR